MGEFDEGGKGHVDQFIMAAPNNRHRCNYTACDTFADSPDARQTNFKLGRKLVDPL